MIAKKEWFRPRIMGWGLRPVVWEGWVYIAIAVLLFLAALNLPINDIAKITIAGIIMAVFLIDSIIVMFQMYKGLDERQRKHQQIIETSVSYAAVGAIMVVAIYESLVLNKISISLFVVLGVMAVTKIAVSLYLMKTK